MQTALQSQGLATYFQCMHISGWFQASQIGGQIKQSEHSFSGTDQNSSSATRGKVREQLCTQVPVLFEGILQQAKELRELRSWCRDFTPAWGKPEGLSAGQAHRGQKVGMPRVPWLTGG